MCQTKIGLYDPKEFAKYPNSKTAQKYMLAFKSFYEGVQCLYSYASSRDKVETDADCSMLEAGFRSYALGFILENLMIKQFQPPEKTMDLLEQYLQLRPLDFFAEYFKLRLFIREQSSEEKLMKNIVVCEVLATKLELRDPTDEVKMLLSEVNGVVAALYTVTKQRPRAIDCFERAINAIEDNTDAIYGVAFNISDTDPIRGEKMLLDFLRKAPKCDKKYPNALYQLSLLYFTLIKSMRKGVRYFELAQLSEKERLPFLPEVDIDAKTLVHNFMALSDKMKYCNNPDCENGDDSKFELKHCIRCKKVSYCGRECQKKDWAYHKKSCK
ncbi:hypothetical protein FSP39_002079 [Pinctada imbricata]|uniref:phytol kinase n=1 Tax=Pinctada imbricata TaxID=66713 RepID=A0AA89C071_PINIB|nr:hypothetical protein FSP39_002079 [Pinctada imbricata]